MEKEMIFHVLGIAETKNEADIRNAYREHLKMTNPEDDPDGFKRLREAYEAALKFAAQPEAEESLEEPAALRTEVETWLLRVNEVYEDIELRYRPAEWEELLSDPVCDGLDTSIEAREKMLAYLMDHIYLPQAVWILLDKKFQIVEEQKLLEEKFPKNFLDYVKYYVEHEGFIPFEAFRILDDFEYQADHYLQNYFSVKKTVDEGESPADGGQEEWKTDCLRRLDDLKAFGVYHPYEDVERIRILLKGGRISEAAGLVDRLECDYPADNYVSAYVGWVRFYQDRKEEAYGIWQKVLDRAPNYYQAKVGTVKCLMEKGDYYEARERMMAILELDGSDQEVLALLNKANEALILEWKEKLERHETVKNLSEEEMELEVGWCLFQNERLDETIEYLKGLTMGAEYEYGYSNLYGRVLYQANRYEEALPHLKRWLELIEKTVDDGSEENRKRRLRQGRACYILSGCCHKLGREEEAVAYASQAVTAAADSRERLGSMQYLSYILCETKQYEKAVDICDELIREDENYYPAYLTRQEACFHLKKAQAVVDDYHRAVAIFSGYYKPYLYAAKVFYYYNQFEDADGVLKRAKENHVEFSPEMKLLEVKILRNWARSNEDRKRPLEICRELLKEAEGETDILDISEIEFEMALLYWDNDENDEAVQHINIAINQNKTRLQYRLVRGNIYLDMERYSEAIKEYEEAESAYSGTASLYYNMGLCYEGKELKRLAMENFEKAAQLQDGFRDSLEKLSDYYHDKYKAEYRKEDYEKALSYMDRQLALTENCYYLVCRGRIYMTAFEFDAAIADFLKALEYVETDWAALNNLGCCYKYMGQFETAIDYFERSVKAMGENKKVLPYSNMADCYEALGNYEKAIWCYEMDLEMFPEYKVFRTEIGKLRGYLGRYREAEATFSVAADQESYYKDMADLWYRQGKYKKAYKMMMKGVKKAEAKEKAARLCDLGEFCLEYLRRFRLAAYWLERAISYDAVHSVKFECEWRLAWTYFLMKEYGKAKRHAEQALEHFKQSGNGSVNDYLAYRQAGPARALRFAWIAIAMGETEKGLALFDHMDSGYRCRICRTGCYEKYLYMGVYYEAVGQKQTAMELYEKAETLNPHSMEVKSAIKMLRKKMKG